MLSLMLNLVRICFWANCSSFLQITDDNYLAYLDNWHAENKPSVVLFDQVPVVPLLYKVSNVYTNTLDY